MKHTTTPMSRSAPRDEMLAKRCNNTCPICWMPLNIENSGVQANKWKDAQVTFKAKPAFSVKENGTDYSRAVLVFGLHPFAGHITSNYQGSHFVHYSMVGNNHVFNKMWDVTNASSNTIHGTGCLTQNEPVKKTQFFDRLFSTGGIFQEAFASGSEAFTLLNHLTSDARIQTSLLGNSALLRLTVVNETFMGCVDCNNKMTIPEFIEPLFSMLFPPDTYEPMAGGKRKKKNKQQDQPVSPREAGFDSEMMMHYLMLCGVLKIGNKYPVDTGDGQKQFHVPDKNERDTWLLRYLMMWCCLQIQFSNWKMASLYKGIRHHSDYVYRGVVDFYLSLWYYALYYVTAIDRTGNINFDEFCYYYTSMMPFYKLQAAQPPVNKINNLSSLVLGEDHMGTSPIPKSLDDVQREIRDVFDKVIHFWNNGGMKDLCLCIHSRVGLALPAYFIPYAVVEQRRSTVISRDFPLSIQSFCDLLSPYWYWFHFKYITMPVIAKTSNEYRLRAGLPQTARTLWFQWCRVFGERVRGLGVRFHMKQRRIKMDHP